MGFCRNRYVIFASKRQKRVCPRKKGRNMYLLRIIIKNYYIISKYVDIPTVNFYSQTAIKLTSAVDVQYIGGRKFIILKNLFLQNIPILAQQLHTEKKKTAWRRSNVLSIYFELLKSGKGSLLKCLCSFKSIFKLKYASQVRRDDC